jgi:uncharacterized membrane protein
MKDRPKIKLELTIADKIIELVGWISIVLVWIFTTTHFNQIPDIIPIHFNGAGQADGFGGKATIFTLPIISTLLFLLLTWLNNFPQLFNFPTNITKENALQQYIFATRLIRYTKVIVVVIFGMIEFKTIQNVNGKADGLGIWFLPIAIGMIFIPLIVYVIISKKAQK